VGDYALAFVEVGRAARDCRGAFQTACRRLRRRAPVLAAQGRVNEARAEYPFRGVQKSRLYGIEFAR